MGYGVPSLKIGDVVDKLYKRVCLGFSGDKNLPQDSMPREQDLMLLAQDTM
jgi:hypothetical protein